MQPGKVVRRQGDEDEEVDIKSKKSVDADHEGVTMIRGKAKDEEGRKVVDKAEIINTRNPDTVRYVEKKLTDKGVIRMDRHPVDGLPVAAGPPKSGRGGKYTWEGPEGEIENELDPVPPAIDEKDPNYVDEEEEERAAKEVPVVIGEVEVAKVAEGREGVARVDVQPELQASVMAD